MKDLNSYTESDKRTASPAVHQSYDLTMNSSENISLCEMLDRVLNKGVVIYGEVTISVANIDLLYLQLRLLVSSIETIKHTFNQNYENESIHGTDTP